MPRPDQRETYSHGGQARIDRERDLLQAAYDAEWDVPAGRLGGLVRQQRRRARNATRNARVLLVLLVVTVLAGLAFYLGQPFFRQWVEGERVALDRGITAAEEQVQALRAEMEVQANAYATAMEDAVEHHRLFSRYGLRGHIHADDVQIYYGDGGTRLAFDWDGEDITDTVAWQISEDGLEASPYDFIGHISLDDAVLYYAPDAALLKVNGSTEDVPLELPWDFRISGHVPLAEGAILYGSSGSSRRNEALAMRVDASGARAVPVRDAATGFRAIEGDFYVAHLAHEGQVYLFGAYGSIISVSPSGASLQRVHTLEPRLKQDIKNLREDGTVLLEPQGEQRIWGATVWEEEILIYGTGGIEARLDLATSELKPGLDPFGETLIGHVNLGEEMLLLYGPRGTLLMLAKGDETLYEIDTRSQLHIWGHAKIENGVLLFGRGNEMLLLRSGTNEPERIPLPFEATLRGAAPGSNRMLIYGQPSVVFGDHLASEIRDVLTSLADAHPSASGDPSSDIAYIAGVQAQFDDFRDDLQDHLRRRGVEEVGIASNISGQAVALAAQLAEDRARQDQFRTFPFSLIWERDQERFAGFMATCRGGAGEAREGMSPAPLTLACLEGWEAQKAAERESWWQILAVQAPPGILLLFLLATLGGLYRYNLRLAGFHHSRADALEVLSLGDVDAAALDKVATALAADKVEFGKASTPTDQAIEMARALRG